MPGGIGWDWGIWPRIAPKEFRLDLGSGEIHFSGDAINGDRGAFAEIFIDVQYRADYRDRVVVDVGAHKGYFGAWALLNGARAVLSYEPEDRNFTMLRRAADSFRARGADWQTVHAAVGAHERQADLLLARDSWSHSLQERPRRSERGRQRVDVVALSRVLEHAQAIGGSILVKIDVEGLECEVVLGTPKAAWASVDDIFVEVHAFAPCGADELVAHLGMQASEANGLLHLSRP